MNPKRSGHFEFSSMEEREIGHVGDPRPLPRPGRVIQIAVSRNNWDKEIILFVLFR